MIDIKKWDDLVLCSPEKSIYSLSWFLDSVTDGKWGIVTDEKYTKGIALAYKTRKGYKNIYQPFYAMFSDVLHEKKGIDEFLIPIESKFDLIHITSNQKSTKYTCKQRIRQELDTKKLKDIKNYSENAIRMVRKAEKNNLIFETHNNAKEVVLFFKENKGKMLNEFKNKDYNRLTKLIDECIDHNHGFCAHVREGNSVLASGFFIEFNNRIIYLKGGVNEEGKTKGAMYFLIHNTIQIAKNQNYIYDFGGSNDNKVAEFYRKFGGQDKTYFEIIIDNETKFQKFFKRIL